MQDSLIKGAIETQPSTQQLYDKQLGCFVIAAWNVFSRSGHFRWHQYALCVSPMAGRDHRSKNGQGACRRQCYTITSSRQSKCMPFPGLHDHELEAIPKCMPFPGLHDHKLETTPTGGEVSSASPEVYALKLAHACDRCWTQVRPTCFRDPALPNVSGGAFERIMV